MLNKMKNNKGFTLIELIVTMAVLSILVLLAAPRLLGYTDKAVVSELTTNARAIQDASQRYYLDEDDWPRLTDEAYTSEEIEAFAEKIYDVTGEEVNLDPNGNYYDIDFDGLESYVSVPGDKANYILQNPVGKVYALRNLNESRFERLPDGYHQSDNPGESGNLEKEEENFEEFVASNDEFEWVNHSSGYEVNGVNGYYRYIGEETTVAIPHEIEGHALTSYHRMFQSTNVKKVISTNKNIKDMSYMFHLARSSELDLSTFNTSNVENMSYMFSNSKAQELNLLSFDTSNVTDMSYIFLNSNATTLDLSSFDTSKVSNTNRMFDGSQVRIGIARTNADAGKLNSSTNKPNRFMFSLKENTDYTWINLNSGYEVNGVTGYYSYIGEETTVTIPHEIEGRTLTSYHRMFQSTNVKKVVSTNKNIKDMSYMFQSARSSKLDLSTFNTSNVTNMSYMFLNLNATTLDLSSFDTSKVNNMRYMFSNSKAQELNLLSFDTSKVTDMSYMFLNSNATTLDLSSFDTSRVSNTTRMFDGSQARIGIARTNVDAKKLNSSRNKPYRLTFEVK